MVEFDHQDWLAIAGLRSLASQGSLADVAGSAPPATRTRLTGAAFTLAWPIVFKRITRVNEQRRGHWSCAIALDRLADDCLDRFYDDVEAVVDDLLTHATTKIGNLEGWLTARLRAATVDAHRRRRGDRGALQRPRLPGWLITRLHGDAWLEQLALQILIWVGVPTTAGVHLWPLDSWAERRAAATGDLAGSDAAAVLRDIDRVLGEMRHRPRWYADYVERPLGNKTPPQAPVPLEAGVVPEWRALTLTDPDAAVEARLTDLASLALLAIEQQLARDPADDAALGRIITTVFGRIDAGSELGQLPRPAGDGAPALVDDPDELRRIVRVVREIAAAGPAAA